MASPLLVTLEVPYSFHHNTCSTLIHFCGCIYLSVLTNLTLLIIIYAFLQLIYRPDNGEILGVHIFGLHAADLIHEASNAIALGTRIQVKFSTIAVIYVCAWHLVINNGHEVFDSYAACLVISTSWYTAGHKICSSCTSNLVRGSWWTIQISKGKLIVDILYSILA